jgi:hypothetical protein
MVSGSDRPVNRPQPSRVVSDAVQDDLALPYAVEPLSLRGRVVRIGPAIDAILKRHDYPAPIARVVGEAAALTVLLGSALKHEGSFQLQTRTNGPLDMLIVDFDAPANLRALARFDPAKLAQAPGARSGDLLGFGHLALTIDPGSEMSRSKGRASRRRRINTSCAPSKFQRSCALRSARPLRRKERTGALAAFSLNSCQSPKTAAVMPISIRETRPRG